MSDTSEIARLRAEREEALRVLAPSMPDSGLVDACRQVKQVAISEADNADRAEAKGRAEAFREVEARLRGEAASHASFRLVNQDVVDALVAAANWCAARAQAEE